MAGKKGLVMGVANERSIAWGIAKACHDQGAELAFTFQGEALEKRVRPLANSIGAKIVTPCDVTNPQSIDATFKEIEKSWGQLDFLVHAIAFSNKDELRGRYLDTSPENFALTMNVSCYSLTAVAQRAVPLMKKGGSIVTLTYYGAERVIPNYNIMGVAKAALEASVRYLAADLGKENIRVNAISAGPIKTLAFAGIADGRYILKWNELNSPLKRNVTTEEVGKALNEEGIAVRTGHHCTQPLMERFGIEGTVRASFAAYNTIEEIDRFIAAIDRVAQTGKAR